MNGKKTGEHKNGYTPFWFDITSMLNQVGEPNVIAVKVENNGRNSRWYSGSGIYRDVHLSLVNPLHVAPWGVYITTPEITQNSATANIEVTLRNHPSIIMWSIGNEIYEKEESNRLRIAKELAARVRKLDKTRPVTNAITGFFYPDGWEITAPAFELVDVCGYNYMYDKVESDHQKYPERIMYFSESYSKMAYDFWQAVEKHPYVIGDFIWTGWDYIGEVSIGKPSYIPAGQDLGFSGNFSDFKLPEGVNIFDLQAQRPSNWPEYLANCGDIDIASEKTPQMLYRDVLWGNSNLEINVHEPIPEGMEEFGMAWAWPLEFPHWNWQGNEGKPLQVRVFTRADKVRLFLNGEQVGEKLLSAEDKFIATFEVPYQPGELRAVATENGEVVEEKILKTSGNPTSIRLSAERDQIRADRNDLAYVRIEVVDENGQVVPQDSVQIRLTVSGQGELAASGNAGSDNMESFNSPVIKTYQGRAQAILRPFSHAGEIVLRAESEGLNNAEVVVTTQQ